MSPRLFRGALAPFALSVGLAACADDPVAVHPLGPGATGPDASITVGCPAGCKLPQPRILFSLTDEGASLWTVNPDGTGLVSEAIEARDGAWAPTYDRFVAVRASGSIVDDIAAYTIGNGLPTHRYTLNPDHDLDPAVSADGKFIAFASDRGSALGHRQIFVVPTAQATTGTQIEQLTFDAFDHRSPHWSPDGKGLLFSSTKPIATGIQLPVYHIFRFDLATKFTYLLSPLEGRDPVYSPDGTHIAFTTATAAGDRVATLPLFPGMQATVLQNGVANASQPSWSRDGTRLAFASTDPAWTGINVMRADGTGVQHVVDFGHRPRWSR